MLSNNKMWMQLVRTWKLEYAETFTGCATPFMMVMVECWTVGGCCCKRKIILADEGSSYPHTTNMLISSLWQFPATHSQQTGDSCSFSFVASDDFFSYRVGVFSPFDICFVDLMNEHLSILKISIIILGKSLSITTCCIFDAKINRLPSNMCFIFDA